MTKEEIQIAQAAYCVGKMWDEYEGTEDFDRLVRKRVQHIIELVRNYQPYLPDNLDEAAHDYANTHYGEFVEVEYEFGYPIETIVDDKPFVRDAFKAGAEWMVGQGYTVDGIVFCDKELTGGYKDIVMSIPDELKVNDKVTIQIRKKEEK